VSLVALGLCFLCGGYLLRWIFIEQKKNIAIYKTLGLQNSEMIQIQILKNTAMSVVSFLISSTVVFLVLPFVQQTLSRYQLPITLEFSAYSFWITFDQSDCPADDSFAIDD
jgi:ABC-type antimicrobial peptide transport system permease subunit